MHLLNCVSPLSPRQARVLALFEQRDDYQSMKLFFQEIFGKMKEIQANIAEYELPSPSKNKEVSFS